MIYYKGLNFHINNEYHYIEIKLTTLNLINAESFITTVNLISEFSLTYKPNYIVITLAIRYKYNNTYMWFLNQLIIPQLIKSGIKYIILIVEPIILKKLKTVFEHYTCIHLFSDRAGAINWIEKSESDTI